MTIAIAPIMARPSTQSGSADSVAINETPVPGSDFASLLLGQLAVGADLQPSITEPSPPNMDFDTKQPDTIITPQDAAMLLATLGTASSQSNGKTEIEEASTDTLVIVNDGIHLLSNPAATQKETPAANLLGNVPGVPDSLPTQINMAPETAPSIKSALLEIGDKAAKFAVHDFTESKTDALTIKNRTIDTSSTPTSGTSPFASNQPISAISLPSQALRVDTPVRDPAWSGDFAQKIVWLTTNEQKSAQLTLNPPQMGPIEISLNINKDNTSANAYFVSPNAEVREAIETALPRLREMLAGVGIELGQTNVGTQSFRQESGNQAPQHGTPRWGVDGDILGADPRHSQAIITQRGNGLVDIFA